MKRMPTRYEEYQTPINIRNNTNNNLEEDLELEDHNYHIRKHLNGKQVMLFLVMTMISFLIILPIAVLDIYFSHNPFHCYRNDILVSMNYWLKISGLFGLTLILINFCGFINCREKTIFRNYKYLVIITHLIWIAMGSYLFWQYIELSNLCDGELKIYLWIRLILGVLNLFSMGIYFHKLHF